MNLKFYKYQATGNDFILIDDRKEILNTKYFNNNFIENICKRRFNVGADGFIILRNHIEYDFEMIFFNSTGERSTFCGNGGRCIIAFARDIGIIKDNCEFIAYDGAHKGIINKNEISLKMIRPSKIIYNEINKVSYFTIDTGSPHLVKFCDNINKIDVLSEGKKISQLAEFGQHGINVNFIEIKKNKIYIRTYERGDNMESLSCGTGSVAVALGLYEMYRKKYNYFINQKSYLLPQMDTNIQINTKAGVLRINFDYNSHEFSNIWLIGESLLSYQGSIKC